VGRSWADTRPEPRAPGKVSSETFLTTIHRWGGVRVSRSLRGRREGRGQTLFGRCSATLIFGTELIYHLL
jgi:hypothetical protein